MANTKTFQERLLLRPWTHGPVRDYTTSPRLFTGRPKDASKAVAVSLTQFLDLHDIPLWAFTRHIEISGWAVRQAKAGVRSLPVTQENLVSATIERIKGGRLWLRRVGRQRVELEWITPPYKQMCAMNLTHCHGGLLPQSCPRRWIECPMSKPGWERIEEFHKAHAKQETVLR